MSYKKIEGWQLAREVSIGIHEMTLTLPKFNQFEVAIQNQHAQGNFLELISE